MVLAFVLIDFAVRYPQAILNKHWSIQNISFRKTEEILLFRYMHFVFRDRQHYARVYDAGYKYTPLERI